MYQNLTLSNIISFLKAFKGDEILFENSVCGNYTDLTSEIIGVDFCSLRVKINSMYQNPDCVDKNNVTNTNIGSIRSILHKNSSFEELEIDSKIICLEAILKKKKTSFIIFEQKKLDKLLERLKSFYSELLVEGSKMTKPVDRKIERTKYYALFNNL
ncbi:hypothetical protein [Polaribacter sp. Hel1_85]|uniref:hypothetical protein n=1 Tax=Polaribacter sp. Hel1_85 TaxID=1250005 RepID=UPI00052BF2E8|nr:hypothetical protein [Polaribacter sp. Hel1_85]KGL58380.1 hypothetical protein PHEL85_3438 [Polaribacter sp. Hel1_85]